MNYKTISQALAGLLLSVSFASCTINLNVKHANLHKNREAKKENMSPTLGGKLFTSAWIQHSAEYDALCLQAYNSATDYLHLKVKENPNEKWAIVTDIDETIVDNTPVSVSQALKGEDYTQESWDEWCDKGSAEALAGAVKFFNEADKLGVQIFYISNRIERNRKGTLANLRRLGMPQVIDSHLMLNTKTSDKSARREKVLEKYKIMMLIGDALGDFDHIFDSKDPKVRKRAVEQFRNQFGYRFIVLPNPNYGSWEKAMNGGYPALKVKDDILRNKLRKD